MSATRAEIFTSDRGLLKVFFHMRNINEYYSWLVRPISIMIFYLLRAQKNVIDRSIRIFYKHFSPIYEFLHTNNKTQS